MRARPHRLLLLSLYFAPDTAANAVIMTGLAQQLSKQGFDIRVVTSFPHYAANRIDPSYRGRLLQKERLSDGLSVIRCALFLPRDKARLPGRVLSYLSFNLLSLIAGLCAGPCDVILAPSPPLTIGLTAWLLGLLKRAPYVYNVQDIYPDVAIRLGVLRRPMAIALFQHMERFVYRRARAVTVLSEGFRCNLLRKGVPASRLYKIPNFVDGNEITPQPKENPFAERNGLSNRFVALFAGNIGLSQGLETLLDAALLLRDLPDVVILIVGNGAERERLMVLARQMNLDNVRWLPFQPRADLPQMYGAANVGLVLLRGSLGQDSVPSKALTIMAAGRPILAATDSQAETRSLIEEAQCGLSVPAEDPAALAEAIRRLYADPAQAIRWGEQGRHYVELYFTPEKAASAYARLLCSLVERASSHSTQGET